MECGVINEMLKVGVDVTNKECNNFEGTRLLRFEIIMIAVGWPKRLYCMDGIFCMQ
jgi:hypothetical protein